MKKLTLIFMFLWFHGLVIGQISLLETYHIGTKVTYYPNACDTLVPEAEGKISFCDRAGNLGVVEKSFGLNAQSIQRMAFNYWNNDEVFITPGGISIRKEDGTWDNVPSYTTPRTSVNSPYAASMGQALVTPGGKLLFDHRSMAGLHMLNLESKDYEYLPYLNDVGNPMTVYSQVFTYYEANNTTYIVAFSGTHNKYLFSYNDNALNYLGPLPSSSNGGNYASKMFVVRNDMIFLGTSSGLFKINLNNLGDVTLYNNENLLPYTNIFDFQFDNEGNLWIVSGSGYSGAISKMDIEEETVQTYEFVTGNPNINYYFRSVAVDDENTVWTLASNGHGFGKLVFDDEGEPVFEFFPMSYFDNQGFQTVYSPSSVFWMNNKVYFLTSTASTTSNQGYEALIYDDGVWKGISDDEPGNISGYHTRRFGYSYPADDGVWFFNQYDGGVIAFWDHDDNSKKRYGLGGTHSLLVDSDNKPVFSNGTAPKKVDLPLVYTMQDAQSNSIAKVRRYKDLIYAYNRPARQMLVYKNNTIVANYQLDETDYGNLYNFNIDSNGNPWFYRMEGNDIMLKKFDIFTQTTTNYPTGMGNMGYLRYIFPLPNGEMCLVASSGLLVTDNGEFVRIDNSDYSQLWNPIGGVSDINGKLYIFTHDNARIVTIENPFGEEPVFDVIILEGTSGVIPYVSFYRPGGMMFDKEGNFWGHGSGKWLKMTMEEPVIPFLNQGETFGIVGRVYLDKNENNEYDPGEGYGNQKVSIVSGEERFDTYTDPNGEYYFSFIGENTEYTITLPAVSNLVSAPERQRQIEVSDFENNYMVDDFILKSMNINSLMVKSSAKEGLWGFNRNGFDNSFTTAIGNISFAKSFADLELKFTFLREPGDTVTPLPDIEDIKVWRVIPQGSFHIISSLIINPRSHKWDIELSPEFYTLEEIDIVPFTTENDDGLFIDLILGTVQPLETYIIEIQTGLFSPEHTGNTMTFGVHSMKSNDFSDDPDSPTGGKTLFLIPKLQDPRTGDFGDMSPYLDPDDVYDDPPYIDPKDIYSDGPYKPRIFSSYDPNDKLVTPGLPDEINLTDINKKWLTYTVRFQNDGNFSAKDVFIIDEVDENLDLNSLTLLDHSHPMQLSQIQMEDGVALKFSFDDIYLDYSDNDLEASQGYVRFMIKASDSIAPGTIVQNNASIYFDQNPPIITNIVMNQFVELHNLGLRASPEEGGSINIAAAGEYQEGEQITLKAWPNEVDEYYFVNWTRAGALVSDSLEFVYTMTGEDALLIANFQKDSPEIYSLDIFIEPVEGGQVIVKVNDEEQQAPYSFEEGTEVVLEAMAEDNYTFLGWQTGEQSFTDNPITFTMESSFSVTANFDFESGINEDVLSEQPIVFPNPALQNISLQAPFLIERLEIFDARGVRVVSREIKNNFSEINISALSSGMYFVKMYAGETYYTQKLQVIRK